MILHILIANRGEIALRIAQAAADMGLQSTAVFATDEAGTAHRSGATRTVPLGAPGPAAYLDINRLVALASPVYPRAYLELIAIHSGAPCGRTSSTRRWFDLDDPEIQLQLEKNGPQLAHFVARTERAEAGVRELARLGLDRGEVLQASRMTPQGLLQWKISVRDDGERLLFGTLPTLIQWGEVHPAQAMAPSGVSLLSLEARHPRPDLLRAAYQAIGLAGVALGQGAPNLVATLQTPRGPVVLESKGL